MIVNFKSVGKSCFSRLEASQDMNEEELKSLLEEAKDPLSSWLDGQVEDES